jgi:hypothetical protein
MGLRVALVTQLLRSSSITLSCSSRGEPVQDVRKNIRGPNIAISKPEAQHHSRRPACR